MEVDEFGCWSESCIKEQDKRPVAWMSYKWSCPAVEYSGDFRCGTVGKEVRETGVADKGALMQHLLRYWRNEEIKCVMGKQLQLSNMKR
jgi:hypothetical protein